MFTVTEIETAHGILQYRTERLTGIRCRISPERIKRGIEMEPSYPQNREGCPFCPENILQETPAFRDGNRICIGESVTFPNLYPYAERHTVTVITREHSPADFSLRQLTDAIEAQTESLADYRGYHSINWNYLPSAGASLLHPHFQGLADKTPSRLPACYIHASQKYLEENGRRYSDDFCEREREAGRFLFGDEITWVANPVPLGEREVRGILPVSSLDELGPFIGVLAEGLLRIIHFYRDLGTFSFNFSLFFAKPGIKPGYRAFCSVISRINPNPASISDTAFMERLHHEPVIMTLPEDLAAAYRDM